MRLFLSSFRFGAHRDIVLGWHPPPASVAVIANAADAWTPAARRSAVTSDLVPLRQLGYHADEIDLREFHGREAALARTLRAHQIVWVRGGNPFVLRTQYALSGADRVLTELVRGAELTYLGYSAGAAVMCPSLRGLERSESVNEVRTACGIDPIFDGLGFVDRLIVPHYRSITDIDGASEALVQTLTAADVPHWALTDEQAVIVDNGVVRVL